MSERRHGPLSRPGAGVALVLAFVTSALASGPVLWIQAGIAQLSQGEHVGVAVSASGSLELAPEVELVLDAGVPRAWSVVSGEDGDVYLASGEDGRVVRIRPGHESATFFEVAERGIQAMAWGPDGHLYVATGPSGAVFRVPAGHPGGPLEPWFVPGTKYVWDMAFDAQGGLLLATGGDGKVLRVDAAANATELYDTPEPHVTALALDGRGNVIAGTSGSGLVYRISPGGDVFVLYDAPAAEITDLLVLGDEIWAAGFGAAQEPSKGAAPEGSSPRVSFASGSSSGTAGAAGAGGSVSGAVYRIHDDGYAESVWSSDSEGAYALAAFAGGVVAGTGGEGRLLRIQGESTGLVTRLDAAQIVALEPAGDGELIAATSNVAKVFRIRSAFRAEGEYVSVPKDTGAASRWGTIRWLATQPEGTEVVLSTRSGNTASPDDTWSPWTRVTGAASGAAVASPPARFLQWRAQLVRGRGSASPALHRVEVAFVPRNLPPVITALTVHPAGVVYRENSNFEDGMPFAQVPEVVLRELREMTPGGPGAAISQGIAFLGRPLFVRGRQTLTWEASDPNGDEISYRLQVRGELEQTWKDLAGPMSEVAYVLDTSRLADGAYLARLIAGDGQSNPEGAALADEKVSRTFFVDNTGPTLSGLRAEVAGSTVAVAGSVSDASSLIRQIRYSLDGGEWHTVRAADGVADSAAETIAFSVEGLGPGEHTVMVSVSDTALNDTAGKVVFVIR